MQFRPHRVFVSLFAVVTPPVLPIGRPAVLPLSVLQRCGRWQGRGGGEARTVAWFTETIVRPCIMITGLESASNARNMSER